MILKIMILSISFFERVCLHIIVCSENNEEKLLWGVISTCMAAGFIQRIASTSRVIKARKISENVITFLILLTFAMNT